MTKAELREKYRALRRALTKTQVEEFSCRLTQQLSRLPMWEGTYYHIFLSIEHRAEVATHFVLEMLRERHKKIVVPKMDSATGALAHYLLTEQTLVATNYFGIREPVSGTQVPVSAIDVVFVPLLAFDLAGHRVGYGKGFYDRFLSQCRPGTLKIGLSLFDAETGIDDVSPADVRLTHAVTPDRVCFFPD